MPYTFLSTLLFLVIASVSVNAGAQLVNGDIYLSAGEIIHARDNVRIVIPVGKKPLRVVENAYSASQKDIQRILPEEVDSIVVWISTAPERPHLLRFLAGIGWCWRLENGRLISVYSFSKKGYGLGGNGGMWARRKSQIIIDKKGEIYKFDKPGAYANSKFIRRAASIAEGDTGLVEMIQRAHTTRDKILRTLSLYNPNN